MYGCYCYNIGINNSNLFSGGTYLAKLLRNLFEIKISFDPGINALFVGMISSIWLRIFIELVCIFKICGWLFIYLLLNARELKKFL